MRPNNQWQSKSGNGFALSDFSIDRKNKQVTCPTEQTTTNWYQRKLNGAENIRVRFKRSQCNDCEHRTLCTRSAHDGRSLCFAGEENHRVLEKLEKYRIKQRGKNFTISEPELKGRFRKPSEASVCGAAATLGSGERICMIWRRQRRSILVEVSIG